MFRKMLCVAAALGLTGCAVSYTPSLPETQMVDHPTVGEIVTARIGDEMLTKGVLVSEDVVDLKKSVDGVFYDIRSGVYPKLGDKGEEQFFDPSGIIRAALADPVQLLSVKKPGAKQVCVVTVYGARACYDADFEIKKRTTAREASFQQTLIYSGKVGDKINIGYREFSGNTARPAFNNDVEYDLSTSSRIGYKGAELEVIKADNTGITYKVISTFR
ncbi:hypothetical protein [Castellaniella sp.]|uniref:hypothetical protein n=1 Tax=Castellaniella sp. TaxID=1955812 RepID=UPI003C770F90